MHLDDMALLIRVAETGSMTLSAKQLNLTPAAVSAAVARVEQSISQKVFERTTRSVRPTQEGLRVLEGCHRVLSTWAQTVSSLQNPDQSLSGTIHISAPLDTTYRVLSPLLARLVEEHPKLHIVTHASDFVQHMHRDAIDLAIRYGKLEDSGMASQKLVSCREILVASPEYLRAFGTPEHPSELKNHRILTLKRDGRAEQQWMLMRGKESIVCDFDSRLCADGFLTRRWAIEGLGIARKSLFDVIDELESGTLVSVLSKYRGAHYDINALLPSRGYHPARVLAVREGIASLFKSRGERCRRYRERHLSNGRS